MTARERFVDADVHFIKRKGKYHLGLLGDATGKNGKRRYRSLRLIRGPAAPHGTGNMALARKIANQMMAKGDMFAARDDLRAFLLDFWDPDKSEYLRSRKADGHELAVAYIDANCSAIERHFLPYFEGRGLRTLADLTPATLEAWRNWLRIDEKTSARTVNRTRQVVFTALQYAVDVGLLPYHPGQRVKRLREDTPERQIFELEELAKLFAAPWDDLRAYAAAMLAASTGMRLGEVLGLLVRNAHLDKGYLDVVTNYVRTEGMKGPKWGSERIGVPLPARVIEAIRAVLATHRWDARPDDFVFYSIDTPARPMSAGMIDTALRRAAKAAGLPAGRTFHNFRHTFISHASRELSPAALRYHVGHSNAATTELYEHVTAEDRAALEHAQARILPFKAAQ